MNFQQIAAHFRASQSGTDSFKVLFRDAFELMKAEPDNAALYFIVGIAAQSYVRRYEDQGVTPDFADRAKAAMTGWTDKLLAALDADPATRLRLAGEVAVDYQWGVSDF